MAVIYDVARVMTSRPDEPTPLYEVVVQAVGADPMADPMEDIAKFEVSFDDLTGGHRNGQDADSAEAPAADGELVVDEDVSVAAAAETPVAPAPRTASGPASDESVTPYQSAVDEVDPEVTQRAPKSGPADFTPPAGLAPAPRAPYGDQNADVTAIWSGAVTQPVVKRRPRPRPA